MTHPLFALFDLRLRVADLELRLPDDHELAALCRVARKGVHDPAHMPFLVPWTDKASPRFEREFAQYHWGARANWAPASWSLELAVFVNGEPVGSQGISAENFATLRQVITGSWLGQKFQGRGFGKQMREAVLHLAFEGLGAEVAHSAFIDGNVTSAAVSRTFGYEPNGRKRVAPRGEPVWENKLILTRERWQARPRAYHVEVEGLDACRELFGATP
jgi:RimJ/RimL family protein N-acetyltransferase